MSSRGEGATSDFSSKESGCGPDTDSRHAGQDRVKRVCEDPLFHLKRNLVSLLAQSDELTGKARQNNDSGVSAGNDDGLLCKRLSYLGGKAFPQPGSQLQSWVASFLSLSEASFSGEGYRWIRSSIAG